MPGSLTRRELAERYATTAGRACSDLLFFYVYGLFKIAVIAQQIYARYVRAQPAIRDSPRSDRSSRRSANRPDGPSMPVLFDTTSNTKRDNRLMIPPDPSAPLDPAAHRRFLPVLLVLFVGSGCAALIYEVVWLQLLQLVIGSTAVSMGVLLGTFMGGMCLGSLLLPRVVSIRRHPLRVYAALELGIGAIGLAVLFGMPYVEQVYVSYTGRGMPAILLRGTVAAACLLPPTLLMGATLPAIALGRDQRRGRLMAGLLLRRQYRGGCRRLPGRRLLPAARLRHGHRDLRRRRHQCHRGRDRPVPGGRSGAVRAAGRCRNEGEHGAYTRHVGRVPRDRLIRSVGAAAPRWCGRGCSLSCWAARSTRSR